MSLQIPILGDLTGLQAALRNVPGMVGNSLQQANVAGRAAFGGLFGGLRSTVSSFAGFLSSSLVNAVGAVGIVQAFRSTIQQLDRVGDLSQRFGVSADALQRLGGVAELSGGSMQDVANALQKVSRLAAEATSGNDAAAKSFEKIGLNVGDIRGLNAEELFLKVSDQIASLSSETDQAAAAFEIFGRAGGNIVVMAQMGSENILAMANGITVASNESVAAAQEIDDAFKTLGQNFTSVIGQMLVVLNPLINGFLKLSNVVISGIGVAFAGLGGLFTGNSANFEKALEKARAANLSLFSDPFGSLTPAGSTRPAVAGTRQLVQPAEAEKASKGPNEDSIRAKIDQILSSGRGIEAPQIIADSLAKIGGGGGSVVVAGSDREQQRLLGEQLAALKKIEKNTAPTEVARLK